MNRPEREQTWAEAINQVIPLLLLLLVVVIIYAIWQINKLQIDADLLRLATKYGVDYKP